MKVTKSTGLVLAGALLLAVSGAILAGQGGGAEQEKQEKELKQVPVTYNSKPESGAQMYKDYCAACHGMEGKGKGPVVEFLKAPPPDLTTMDGVFDASLVTETCPD